MKVSELISFSRRLIKGSRKKILVICMLPLSAELFFRLAEAAMYSMLLYFSGSGAYTLFISMQPEKIVLSWIFAVLRWIFFAPLCCCAAVQLSGHCCCKALPPIWELILSRKFVLRSIGLILISKIMGLLLLSPALLAFGYVYHLLKTGADTSGVFVSAICIAVGVCSLCLWFSSRLGLAAAPFLMYYKKDKGCFSLAASSLKLMKGRRLLLLKLMLIYAAPAATIVGLPFVLPEISSAFAMGVSIFLQEDELSAVSLPKNKERRRA